MKLPINQFLYLAIAGLLGGSGWQFYETWKEIRKEDARAEARQRDAGETCRLRLEKGRSLNVVSKGPNYAQNEPWDHFKEANLIGKLPPPPPKPIDPQETRQPEKPPETPLEEICAIVCLVFQGQDSMAIIRYQETSNVEPPEEILDAYSAPEAQPTRRTNRNKRNQGTVKTPRPIARAMPAVRVGGYVQTLRLEENLWPPYDHIKLVAIDPFAEFAEFTRTDDDGSESEPTPLFRDELGLSQAVLARLHEQGYASGSKPKPIERPSGDQLAEIPRGPFGNWAGGEETKRINGDFHIGRKEWSDWNEDSSRIFNRELQTKSYSGRNGVSGVQITQVSERFQQFGVQSGDVVISVNGEAVRSKAQAITVGKRQYKRGTRTFDVVFLSRGREVTRTYVAPDEGR